MSRTQLLLANTAATQYIQARKSHCMSNVAVIHGGNRSNHSLRHNVQWLGSAIFGRCIVKTVCKSKYIIIYKAELWPKTPFILGGCFHEVSLELCTFEIVSSHSVPSLWEISWWTLHKIHTIYPMRTSNDKFQDKFLWLMWQEIKSC